MSWLSTAWNWYGEVSQKGAVDHPHAALVNPLITGIGGGILIFLAIHQARAATRQAATAAQQAETARKRHEAQTEADQRRRITESFTNATEQLGSDKIEVRLGGIYTLERVSREGSEDDYWTVMQTLCAFVREYARWTSPDVVSSETVARFYEKTEIKESKPKPPTDIAAILQVIVRREKRDLERVRTWELDLSGADLRGADLRKAHLESANLSGAHFEGANLWQARLDGAYLMNACFRGASLNDTHLTDADLAGAHLEGTFLAETRLDGARLASARLEGANLRRALGLTDEGNPLSLSYGDAKTQLPAGLTRPEWWPAANVDGDPIPPSPETV